MDYIFGFERPIFREYQGPLLPLFFNLPPLSSPSLSFAPPTGKRKKKRMDPLLFSIPPSSPPLLLLLLIAVCQRAEEEEVAGMGDRGGAEHKALVPCIDSKKLSDEIHKKFTLHWPRSRLKTNVISETPDFCRERQSHETHPKAFPPPPPPLSGKPAPTTATEPTEGAPSTQKEREREKKFPLFLYSFHGFPPLFSLASEKWKRKRNSTSPSLPPFLLSPFIFHRECVFPPLRSFQKVDFRTPLSQARKCFCHLTACCFASRAAQWPLRTHKGEGEGGAEVEEEEGKRGAVDAVDGLDGPPFLFPSPPPLFPFYHHTLSLRRERCVGMAAVVVAYRSTAFDAKNTGTFAEQTSGIQKRDVFTSGEKLRAKSKLPECLWLNAETPAVLRSAGEERERVGSRGPFFHGWW